MFDWRKVLKTYSAWFTVIGLLIVWQLCGEWGLLPRFVLPSPLQIGQAFVKRRSLLLHHAGYTVAEAIIGIGLGGVLAWGLALVMDRFVGLQRALYPLIIMIQSVPTTALAPLLILWMGYGMLPKIVLIVLTTTFPMLVGILDGFRQTDEDLLTLLRLMRASHWQLLWHVKIPHSLSYFYAGLRISVSYAFISAVVSEWLGGFDGLGIYMIMAKKLFEYDTMFAIIILISAISLLGMKLVSISEPYVMKWRYLGGKKDV